LLLNAVAQTTRKTPQEEEHIAKISASTKLTDEEKFAAIEKYTLAGIMEQRTAIDLSPAAIKSFRIHFAERKTAPASGP
jgi:hypothetical protein